MRWNYSTRDSLEGYWEWALKSMRSVGWKCTGDRKLQVNEYCGGTRSVDLASQDEIRSDDLAEHLLWARWSCRSHFFDEGRCFKISSWVLLRKEVVLNELFLPNDPAPPMVREANVTERHPNFVNKHSFNEDFTYRRAIDDVIHI